LGIVISKDLTLTILKKWEKAEIGEYLCAFPSRKRKITEKEKKKKKKPEKNLIYLRDTFLLIEFSMI